jgi:uncharacterized OB-fold protein
MADATGGGGPAPDPDSEFFWAGLERGQVLIQRCLSCRRPRFPAMPGCPACGATAVELVEISGAGEVYSWIVVHRTADPARAGDIPYTIVTVDLDDGVRMFGRLEGAERPEIGACVEAFFVARDGWTELRFRPVTSHPRRRQGCRDEIR